MKAALVVAVLGIALTPSRAEAEVRGAGAGSAGGAQGARFL